MRTQNETTFENSLWEGCTLLDSPTLDAALLGAVTLTVNWALEQDADTANLSSSRSVIQRKSALSHAVRVAGCLEKSLL